MRALRFVIQNAREAILEKGEGGVIQVATRVEKDSVILEITDDGVGFEAQQAAFHFRQGYSTKSGHRGLGLHYCAKIIFNLTPLFHSIFGFLEGFSFFSQ